MTWFTPPKHVDEPAPEQASSNGVHPARTRVLEPVPRDVVARAVGTELRRMRKRAHLSLGQSERRTGLDKRVICAHEHGYSAMRIDTLTRYMRAYNGSLLEIERAIERALAGQEP